jgi:hypothetical protein
MPMLIVQTAPCGIQLKWNKQNLNRAQGPSSLAALLLGLETATGMKVGGSSGADCLTACARYLQSHRKVEQPVLLGTVPPRTGGEGVTVFGHIFGLGVLDLAAGRVLRNLAEGEGIGMRVEGFLPGG